MHIDDTPGFDVIGDVHGMGHELVALLTQMNYRSVGGHFVHPTRTAVFVGDLVDRGPEQMLAVDTARGMVEAGAAHIVMGNHELNAIHFATRHRETGNYLRPRTEKNVGQHQALIDAVGSDSATHRDMIDWFSRLPLWLELDLEGARCRFVHACWDENSMRALPNGRFLDDDAIQATAQAGSAAYNAVEVLLKGPEIAIDPPYLDKDKNRRPKARFAWWKPRGLTLSESIERQPNITAEDGSPWELKNPDAPVQSPVTPYPADAPPLFYGHYWRRGNPSDSIVTNTACTDFSACKGGVLAAYRWSGEQLLDASNFCWVG